MTEDIEENQERVMSYKRKEERSSSSLHQILKSCKEKKNEIAFNWQYGGQPNLDKYTLGAMEREACLEGFRRDRS